MYEDPKIQMMLKDMNRKDRRKWLKEHGMLGKPLPITINVDNFGSDKEFNPVTSTTSIKG